MKQKSVDNIQQNNGTKNSLWGKQTQLSLQYFTIGSHCFSMDFINSLINIKKACAQVNYNEGLLDKDIYQSILHACSELQLNDYSIQFPLSVWQTGSGTQTNMNVNEVIASLANTFKAKKITDAQTKQQLSRTIHPNDHVNLSQSSNDVFPSAMHIVVAVLTHNRLLKSLAHLKSSLNEKQQQFKDDFTVGRTHLMDALPLSAGAVFSGYYEQLSQANNAILDSLPTIYQLALGGTAVGGGDNAPINFGQKAAKELSELYQLPFTASNNTYAAVSGEDAIIRYSSALKQLASVLFKMVNDFRMLGSGPRCGLNEWLLPANEPGSSIMPGKVNPTQCEALSMVCLQIFGNELTVSLAASNGQLQLNTYRPVIIHNVMESIELLTDAMTSFADHCVSGLELNKTQINTNMQQNLSVVTLLAPTLGYDVATQIVHVANDNNLSLAQAAEKLNLYSITEFEVLLSQSLHNKNTN
ncbi:class II fumarate hydratase [Thalassotalea profundi]|uniref:fumarate hydratase n=1 Tax=Thalassotalea profundi TaxID=2036687 RepID=A0ABQ3IKN0_9GAMM|nr:class II fumarate hydratase [Thalassotalea profundi]GHE81830.1 fumarate hydratase class II [Thalassotalea profundi]